MDLDRGHLAPGTTSACAENTSLGASEKDIKGNYLRVRGEYSRCPSTEKMKVELPPRARRIHGRHQSRVVACGTTSACAENTSDAMLDIILPGNYLRVRGEYLLIWRSCLTCTELPPRARRILELRFNLFMASGTTSACAENTRQTTTRVG